MKDGLHRMFNSRELASGIVSGSCAMQEGGISPMVRFGQSPDRRLRVRVNRRNLARFPLLIRSETRNPPQSSRLRITEGSPS